MQLAVRLGVHTGLVVVGEVGGGTRQEQLALGETPNLASPPARARRTQYAGDQCGNLAAPRGFFACQSLGTPLLKGFAQPLEVYQVLAEYSAQSPGRGWQHRPDHSWAASRRWGCCGSAGRRMKDGLGQVVLLSGEAGIGKSRLVQVLQGMWPVSRRRG